MPAQTAPHCFGVLSTENFIELQDDLYRRGLFECYHQRCQKELAAESPASTHSPAPSLPLVNGIPRTVTAQVYAKSIIGQLAKASAQDGRLVRDFINIKFALIRLWRLKDIALAYHSRLLKYQRKKQVFDARRFIGMKALVVVDDLINQLSSKEDVLEHLGVIYYFTGSELLRMAHDCISWYPNLLVTLFQHVDDRVTEEMSTNKCQISDIMGSLDGSLYRSIIDLHQRTLVLRVQELRTLYLEEIEATWAYYKDLKQEDIHRFGEPWEWMSGRKLHLKLGAGETTYPLPEQDLNYHHENLRHAMIVFGRSVENDRREEDLDQDIGQLLHSSCISIPRVGPGEEPGYHYFPELGHAMLCIDSKTEKNGVVN